VAFSPFPFFSLVAAAARSSGEGRAGGRRAAASLLFPLFVSERWEAWSTTKWSFSLFFFFSLSPLFSARAGKRTRRREIFFFFSFFLFSFSFYALMDTRRREEERGSARTRARFFSSPFFPLPLYPGDNRVPARTASGRHFSPSLFFSPSSSADRHHGAEKRSNEAEMVRRGSSGWNPLNLLSSLLLPAGRRRSEEKEDEIRSMSSFFFFFFFFFCSLVVRK